MKKLLTEKQAKKLIFSIAGNIHKIAKWKSIIEKWNEKGWIKKSKKEKDKKYYRYAETFSEEEFEDCYEDNYDEYEKCNDWMINT